MVFHNSDNAHDSFALRLKDSQLQTASSIWPVLTWVCLNNRTSPNPFVYHHFANKDWGIQTFEQTFQTCQCYPELPGVVLESNVSEELIKDIKDFLREATPSQLEGLCLFQIARWAGTPYHQTLEKPPAPSRKYVLKGFQCGDLKIGLWCKLSISSLPSFAGAMLTLSSFSATLDVDGARVKLERQSFFIGSKPFEGTLEALANLIVERYKPCIRHSWRSLINNSNAVLGGLFSRHAWNPRKATNKTLIPAVLCVWNGVVTLRSEVPKADMVQAGVKLECNSNIMW